jgi:hypothetical protein
VCFRGVCGPSARSAPGPLLIWAIARAMMAMTWHPQREMGTRAGGAPAGDPSRTARPLPAPRVGLVRESVPGLKSPARAPGPGPRLCHGKTGGPPLATELRVRVPASRPSREHLAIGAGSCDGAKSRVPWLPRPERWFRDIDLRFAVQSPALDAAETGQMRQIRTEKL